MTAPAGAVAALQLALAGEHAAVYAYGMLAPHLPHDRAAVATAFDAHRYRRDQLQDLLAGRRASAVGPAPGYDVAPPASAAAALGLAATIEDRLASAYCDLLAAPGAADLRRFAATVLQEVAVRAVGWRLAAGAPPTRAFPGR